MVQTAIPTLDNHEAKGLNTFDAERERIHRQMLSSVSHDLKTPLASIIGSLEVYERMKTKLSEEKQAALIAVALQEAYRLDNFITNMLDMAKLENSVVKTRREDVELSAVVRDCLINLNNRLRSSTVTIGSTHPIQAITDPVLLSRAICLVLDNAVKYGGTPSAITIQFGEDANHSGFITIHDNGRGIPEGQMEAIFSKYTRFPKEDQQNAGTGLGLAICRAIMNLLGGDVVVANDAQGGASFTLHLPLA